MFLFVRVGFLNESQLEQAIQRGRAVKAERDFVGSYSTRCRYKAKVDGEQRAAVKLCDPLRFGHPQITWLFMCFILLLFFHHLVHAVSQSHVCKLTVTLKKKKSFFFPCGFWGWSWEVFMYFWMSEEHHFPADPLDRIVVTLILPVDCSEEYFEIAKPNQYHFIFIPTAFWSQWSQKPSESYPHLNETHN